jgi:hypothetical protein
MVNVMDMFCAFSEGSNLTPAHHLSDFRFKTYAPIAFRYFRDLFGIQPEDFMVSSPLCRCLFPWHLFVIVFFLGSVVVVVVGGYTAFGGIFISLTLIIIIMIIVVVVVIMIII